MGIEELPDVPVEIVIWALVSHSRAFSRKRSLRMFHMKPADQNTPQRFEAPKRDEASARSEKSA